MWCDLKNKQKKTGSGSFKFHCWKGGGGGLIIPEGAEISAHNNILLRKEVGGGGLLNLLIAHADQTHACRGRFTYSQQ